jgi:hypothetical protein
MIRKTDTPLWHLVFVAGDFIFAFLVFLFALIVFWIFN